MPARSAASAGQDGRRSGKRFASWPDWWPHATAAAVVSLLIAALAGLSLWQEHQRQRERALVAAQNVVSLLEAHVSEVMAQCDAVLADLASQHTGGRADGGGRVLQPWRARLPAARALRQVRFTPGNVIPKLPEAAASSAATDMVVSGPVRDPAQGDWALALARPVRVGEGHVLGFVTAQLPVSVFAPRFRSLHLGERGAATIRTDQLALVFRQPWPSDEATLGTSTVSGGLRDALAAQPEVGTYVAPTAIDGIERVNAYRRVGGHGLLVLVGLATRDFAGAWNETAMMIGVFALIGVGATVSMSLLLYRGSRRQIDAARRRFEEVVQFSRDAIVCKSLDGVVTAWNPGAAAIFGYGEDEMIGRPITMLLPAEHWHEETEILARIARGEHIEPFDTVRLRRDGQRVDLSVSVAPLFDEQGRIVGASSIGRDVTRQKAMEEEIRSLAFHDPLTQLPNRRLLLDRLEHALQAARRNRTFGVVIFIDLDHFKVLNDHHGHEAGDRLLVDVARRLNATVRQSDTVARLGGDEFVLVCTELGSDAALARAEALTLAAKVESALEHDIRFGDDVFHCRASVGHQLFDGEAERSENLLRRADEAMYRTKSRHHAEDDGPGTIRGGRPQVNRA